MHPELNNVEYDKDYKKYLISSAIPTAEYFKERLNSIDVRLDTHTELSRDLKLDMDRRFDESKQDYRDLKSDMDSRFDESNKNYCDLRSDVDKRFDKMDDKFDKLFALLENRDRD